MSVPETLARAPLLLASLLAPGWLLLRACRLPRSLAAAFPLSLALIYFLAVALALSGILLSLVHVGTALALACASLALVPTAAPLVVVPPAPRTALARWLLLFLGLTVALFAWRACTQPLSGPDTPFRWNFLALEIARTGDFSYYPPITLADFERYFYADGFAPFVALQYWWSYAVLGTTFPHVTGLVVTAQFAATLVLVSDLVSQGAGRTAGHLAAAVLASSGLVFWAFLLGQETGWIALSLLASLWCWTHTSPAHSGPAALAAAAALLPALVAREYGPALLVAGALLACHAGARGRPLVLFAAAAALLAAPWYLHVWLRCGNPFYSLSPFGLFPTNDTLTGLLESYRERFALPRQRPGFLAYRFADLIVNSPLALAAIPLALAAWRRHRAALLAAALLAALWYSAAAYTSGGLHIANRALAPVLVLVVLLATPVAARLPLPTAARRPLTALAAAAALWSLYVNAAPPAGPVPLSPITWWRELTRITPAPSPSPSRLTPVSLPPGTRILSDNAYFHAAEHAAGFPFPIIPFWTHEVRFLFASDVASAPLAQRLRTLGIGAVHVQRGDSPNWPHWSRHPFFRDIVSTWPLVPNPTGLELRRVPVAP